jgi:hypothetical protein
MAVIMTKVQLLPRKQTETESEDDVALNQDTSVSGHFHATDVKSADSSVARRVCVRIVLRCHGYCNHSSNACRHAYYYCATDTASKTSARLQEVGSSS